MLDLLGLPISINGGTETYEAVKADPAECDDKWVLTMTLTATKTK